MGAVGDPARARLYPQAAALARRVYPELQIGEEYDPQAWPEIEAIGAQLRGDKPQEGFTLGPGQQRYGPDGQPIAAVPPTPPAPQRPVSLSEGGVLVDPETGQVIARGPAKREPRPPQAPRTPVWVKMDGKFVDLAGVAPSGAEPASTREQGRPVTSGDAGRIADFDTSLDDLGVLRETVTGSGATGTSARIGAALWNPITNLTGIGEEAKAKQAAIDRVKQVIGKTLEGGVLRKEDEAKYEKILPTIGDAPAVVEAKLAGLEQAIQLRRQRFLESLSDANYDTGRYEGRGAAPQGAPASRSASPVARPSGGAPVRVTSPAEAQSLPPGTLYQTPDGRTMRR
jgi:hypothetical protein